MGMPSSNCQGQETAGVFDIAVFSTLGRKTREPRILENYRRRTEREFKHMYAERNSLLESLLVSFKKLGDQRVL